jgi:phosphoserine phosphatase
VHDRLLLGVVVSGDGDGCRCAAALERRAAELDVAGRVHPRWTTPARSGAGVRHHVTVLGRAADAGRAGRHRPPGGGVRRQHRPDPAAVQLPDHGVRPAGVGGQTERLRAELAAEAVVQSVDVAVEQATLWRRARRLVVMDVDSTLVRGEVIEMLAAQAGCEAEVARVTEQAMAGELDFEAVAARRVALLEGLPLSAVDAVRAQVRLTPAAARWCARSSGSAGRSAS